MCEPHTPQVAKEMLVASPRKPLQYKLNRYNSYGAATSRTRFEPANVALSCPWMCVRVGGV